MLAAACAVAGVAALTSPGWALLTAALLLVRDWHHDAIETWERFAKWRAARQANRIPRSHPTTTLEGRRQIALVTLPLGLVVGLVAAASLFGIAAAGLGLGAVLVVAGLGYGWNA